MTDTVRAPAAATAQGPRTSDRLGGTINPEDTDTAPANQELADIFSELFVDIAATGAATTVPRAAQAGLAEQAYVPKHIKRDRRTKAEISAIRDVIREILQESNPQTVRQVFYALTVRGVRVDCRQHTMATEAGDLHRDRGVSQLYV